MKTYVPKSVDNATGDEAVSAQASQSAHNKFSVAQNRDRFAGIVHHFHTNHEDVR